MNPISVPDSARAGRPWCRVVSMGPPPGVKDEDCGTVEMLIDENRAIPGFSGRSNRVYYRPSQYDLEALFKGGFIEFVQYGNVVQPFSAAIWPSETPNTPEGAA